MSIQTTLTLLDAMGPDGKQVDYLDDLVVPVMLRNEGEDAVEVREISLVFQGHAGMPERLVTITLHCNMAIPSGGTGYKNVVVRPSLHWREATNCGRVYISFVRCASPADAPVREAVGDRCILVRRAPQSGVSVFISFKDPEDREVADLASEILTVAGFRPYMFPNDRFPGAEYWPEKLEPAIRASHGVLVIWTPATSRKPASVLRELTFAQEQRKPVALFLEDGAVAPAQYPASEREYSKFCRAHARENIADAIGACVDRWRQSGRLF